jgi:hypothetical protein
MVMGRLCYDNCLAREERKDIAAALLLPSMGNKTIEVPTYQLVTSTQADL